MSVNLVAISLDADDALKALDNVVLHTEDLGTNDPIRLLALQAWATTDDLYRALTKQIGDS